MRRFALSLALVSVAFSMAKADDLSVAKEALRDGLWEVARTHARNIEGVEARRIILESYTKEHKWQEVLKALESWGYPEEGIFRLYQGAALLKTGDLSNAEEQLRDLELEDEELKKFSERILGEIEYEKGNKEAALKHFEASGAEDCGSLMIRAALCESLKKIDAALKLYRQVATASDASARAKRDAALRIAVIELDNEKTCLAAVGKITEIVKDSPDTDGAADAYLSIADMFLKRGEWSQALKYCSDAAEMWPSAATTVKLRECRGWAYYKLTRYVEAIADFSYVFETSRDREAKSMALLKIAEALTLCGRGQEAPEKYHQIQQEYADTIAANSLEGFLKIRELEAKGREAYRECRFAEAAKFFDEIGVSDNDLYDKMRYFKVLCLYGQGKDLDAENLAKQISEESHDEKVRTDALLWLAKSQYNRGRWENARAMFLKYASEAPNMEEAPYALMWAAKAAFESGDYAKTISIVNEMMEMYPSSPAMAMGWETQGHALINLARFDEAILVLDRVSTIQGAGALVRMQTRMLMADAFFALGADDSKRYEKALETYSEILLYEGISPSMKLTIEYKIARTLDKLKRYDDALERYYLKVVLAYHEGCEKDVVFDKEAKASFSKAAFHLAEEYEAAGRDYQAIKMLTHIVTSDVSTKDEALKKIESIEAKGKFL